MIRSDSEYLTVTLSLGKCQSEFPIKCTGTISDSTEWGCSVEVSGEENELT